MSDRDTIERAIRHIDSCLDVDPWARDIAIDAMKRLLVKTSKTCTDTISRQAAIDAIAETVVRGESLGYGLARDIVYDLPSVQPEQRWIPCTERLPERGVSVLISHVGFVSEDYLDIDDGALFFWNSGIDLDEERQNIAWMPLPSAWKGDNNG